MNSKILFTVLAVCFAQLAYCAVTREVATTENPLIKAFNMANDTLNQFQASFLKLVGVSSNDELWEKAKVTFKSYEEQLQAAVANLNEETKPLQGQAEQLFKSFTSKVSEVHNELKAKNPELFSGDVKQLQAVGERSLRTIVDETQKLRTKLAAAGEEISPKLEATIKQVYEGAVKTADDFKNQVETQVNAIAKKNFF